MQINSLIPWSPKQIKLIELLVDPTDSRTKAEKACALGISPRTLYKWQHLPSWHETVNGLALQSLGGRLPNIFRSVASKAEEGDVSAAKLVFEICGLLDGKPVTVINNANLAAGGTGFSLDLESAQKLLQIAQEMEKTRQSLKEQKEAQ